MFVLLGSILPHFRAGRIAARKSFFQSREIALAYYFAWHLSGGIFAGMLMYVALERAKPLLVVSGALLVAFNGLLLLQRVTVKRIGIFDGLFGGILIASLVLLWLDKPRVKHVNTESPNQPLPTTPEKMR